MRLLVRKGRIIEPLEGIDEIMDLLIEDGRISKMGRSINEKTRLDSVIDASGKLVMPGIFDMHVHLREPGREDKETIGSGTYAAAKGGTTAVLAMPNTTPPIDNVYMVRLLKDLIKDTAKVDVYITGAITIGRGGKELTDIKALKREGVVALSDDGSSVDNDELMRRALIEAKRENLPIICHSEDKSISGKGVINLGFMSTRLGLRGISNESEYKRVERDVRLAEETGGYVHIAHISCRESVEIIRKAKKKGVHVTCETAPHYFSMTEEAIYDYNTNMKVNPPLRSTEDVCAIKEGLKDNTIDIIASDHAPHTESEKELEFDFAEAGTIGLETLFSVSVTELVVPGILSWSELVRKISHMPRKILNLDIAGLRQGADADIVIISPDRDWLVRKEDFVSKSKNSAFIGRRLKGVVEYTIYKGNIIYKLSN